MDTQTFKSTAGIHHCTRFHTLMKPGSHGTVTVTFYFDPNGRSAFVWLIAHGTPGGIGIVAGGNPYTVCEGWHLSLFRHSAREVWDGFVLRGWREIATGTIA